MSRRWRLTYAAAVAAIAAERVRQVAGEGWVASHDDAHVKCELSYAAFAYLEHATGRRDHIRDDGLPVAWPWDAEWWKPRTPRRDLVRAGALCLAETERLARAGQLPDLPTTGLLARTLDALVECLIAEEKGLPFPAVEPQDLKVQP